MTPSDKITEVLQGVRELADKATPGPWEHREMPNTQQCVTAGRGGDDIALMMMDLPEESHNAAFIAASRDMLPRLVAALEHSLETQRVLRDCAITQGRVDYHDKREAELAAILTGDKP